MARLIINPGTPEAWQLELGPGENIIGRGAENQVVLDHPSVSVVHCSLTLSDGVGLLKDLGSSAGTFVDGQPVAELALAPGARFRAGDIELEFQAGVARPSVPEPALQSETELPTVAQGSRCRYHPRALARHFCSHCNTAYCDLCVETRLVSGSSQKICRKCGSPCQGLRVRPVLPQARPEFWRLLPGAFTYPFRGSGIFLLIWGGVFFVFLGWLPLLGFLITGYLFNYAKQIVATSAAGQKEPPDWPDFTNWVDSILVPYFHMLALGALTFGPAVVLATVLPLKEWRDLALVGVAAFLGAFFAPMGMLALAIFDTVTALNPISLAWSIRRIPGSYMVAAVAFEMAMALNYFSDSLVRLVLPVPVLPYVISGFASLYLVAVAMRMVGLLYWSKKEELAWFSR